MSTFHYHRLYQHLSRERIRLRKLHMIIKKCLFDQRCNLTLNSRLKSQDVKVIDATVVKNDHGPIKEYDLRVAAGYLRNDNFQRGIVQELQRLHDELQVYKPSRVSRLKIKHSEQLHMSLYKKLSSILFKHSEVENALAVAGHMPKGLYLYGDVGCGKTMLMDLFYETLPAKTVSKSRFHFHNFIQDAHKRIHKIRLKHGNDIDEIPLVAAEIAEMGTILCFDEFQCTDVADAMILRRFLETLMSYGVILVTTSNRHPDDLYRNGIQRESFIPCIDLLKNCLSVINLNSGVDYRKIPRPSSDVYYTPLDSHAISHAERWFKYLGDFPNDAPHSESKTVWGRKIFVPRVSGRSAMFKFDELIGRPMSAADYIELTKSYDAFIVTDIYGMTFQERDLARRFITFLDAVYEARAIVVLTSAVEFKQLFLSRDEVKERKIIQEGNEKTLTTGEEVEDSMRNMMDDLNLNMEDIKKSSIFSGDEEKFAFSRALSRLSEMGSQEWVNRVLMRMHKL